MLELEIIENLNLLNTNSISQGPPHSPKGKTFKCNIVNILFRCLSFINCFGNFKEPSQETVLLSVHNVCSRCEIGKNALHYIDLIILYRNPFTPIYCYMYIQVCESCVVAWCV